MTKSEKEVLSKSMASHMSRWQMLPLYLQLKQKYLAVCSHSNDNNPHMKSVSVLLILIYGLFVTTKGNNGLH